ncbi:MAG: biopolymer transporter ExbD [Verrucomicrobiota bacterium]
MRRFSQRNSLVTLSDINITPLLDLAFVLLIIFVIISPSIRSAHEQSIQMKLPKGGQPERQIDARDIVTVEVSPQGFYVYKRQRLSLGQIETELVKASRANSNLVVDLRADETSMFKLPVAILNVCEKHSIKWSIRTEAER